MRYYVIIMREKVTFMTKKKKILRYKVKIMTRYHSMIMREKNQNCNIKSKNSET